MKKNDIEHEEITINQFEDTVKQILLSKSEKTSKWKNQMPSKEELEERWKLKKD